MDQITKIILVDDHQIFIEGMKVVLGRSEDLRFEIVAEANSGKELFKLLDSIQADLILLDMDLPDMDGLEILKLMKERGDETKVITLSMYDEPKIVKSAFKAGTYGYILKNNNIQELYNAIDQVLNGETYLGIGLSLINNSGMHARFIQNGKLTASFEDRYVKKYNLTKREIEILKLVGQAKSNKEIASELFISDQTVSVHRKNIMRKIGVSSTASLIRFSYENHIL